MNGWIYAGLAWLGLSVGAIALLSAPVMIVWAAVGFFLGRAQEERVRAGEGGDEKPEPVGVPAGARVGLP